MTTFREDLQPKWATIAQELRDEGLYESYHGEWAGSDANTAANSGPCPCGGSFEYKGYWQRAPYQYRAFAVCQRCRYTIAF